MPGQNQAPGEVMLGYNGDGEPIYGPPGGAPKKGGTQFDSEGRPTGPVDLNDPSDIANVRNAYSQLHGMSDDQVRQYLQAAGVKPGFELGDHLTSANPAFPLSQIHDNSSGSPLSLAAGMLTDTGGAGALLLGGFGGALSDAGAFSGLGIGGGAGGGAGGGSMFTDLPTWAGGVDPSTTLGGGVGGTGLGGASLAGEGLTTGTGVGNSFATGGGTLGGAGVDPLSNPFSLSGNGAGPVDTTGGTTPPATTPPPTTGGVDPPSLPGSIPPLPGNSGGGTGGVNLGSLLPLLGIGSGLGTLLGGSSGAVDPNMINALWQAGQQTYQTSLDPQQALQQRMQGQVVDASRGASSARGLGMGAQSAGLESDAVSKFLQDWQNQQLQRQATGTGAFSQAGNTAANAGIANNAQAFMQNQAGLNNLTSGLGNLFGTGTQAGGTSGGAGGNQLGSWINSLFSGGGNTGANSGGGNYQTFQNSGSGSGGFPAYA